MGAPRILQSPPPANDDELERTQARAERAASIRRRSVAFSPPPAAGRSRGNASIEEEEQPFLNHSQILDLFQNCIKLASENKINQKNTWDLGLIDHLSEIVRVRSNEDDDETNFQKASCTLEAGVKIYSLRVDSVHSEAFKVLGGINRAGREQDDENVAGSDNSQAEVEDLGKKDLGRKLSPLSTLETSYEALNVKKFDVAFTVDPLYHQTSAQFDEGGAKGLLLNNLGVYGGCRVLFDSFESPEKNILSESQSDTAELIDLSFAKEHIEHMITNIPVKNDISPTLMDIVDQFDEDTKRSSNVFPVVQEQVLQGNGYHDNHSEVEDNSFDDCGPWSFDQDDHTSAMEGNFTSTDRNFTSHAEEYGDDSFRDPTVDSRFEKIAGFLSLSLGFTSKSNAWAGPDHWKFRKVKGVEQVPSTDNEKEVATKKIKTKKGVLDLDFTKSLDKEMADIFAPPKNPKSLLLTANRASCNMTLPEDCHYRPENLVRLLILPDVMCLGKRTRKSSDVSRQDDGSIPCASWDNESAADDHFDVGTYNSDSEDPGSLVRAPRQVNKVDIQYDKVLKQVDVHALKNVLWNTIQQSVQMCEVGSEGTISLRKVLHQFSSNCFPMASSQDISPHLYFICLLHLANEHCLSLHDRSTLDELDIQVPASALLK